MALWYEVEKTKQGLADFMECNWEFQGSWEDIEAERWRH